MIEHLHEMSNYVQIVYARVQIFIIDYFNNVL